MFGFGLGFIVDYLDDTIKGPADAEEHGLTLLGIVPQFKSKESLISRKSPKDPICESYRTVRNSLKFANLDKPVNSLLITSSLENEGKTISAANLGISIAREGKSVLLVDTDLRRPAIHKLFEMSNSSGITTILAEMDEPFDVIKKTDVEGLSLLTSGPIPPDPGCMVESAKLKQLIRKLTKQYDIVILDSPPILVANDSIVMAGYVDTSVLILESERTTKRALSQVMERLKQADIQLVGTIINKLRIGRSGYNYYYYYHADYYKG